MQIDPEEHSRNNPPKPGATATNIFRYEQPRTLDTIFAPKRIAVIGATEKVGSVGRTVLWNLISNPFGGTVFPVNLKRNSVLGIKAYPSVKALPEQADLAIVVTPAPTVPNIIAECAEAGVKGAIIISAGFKESGAEGIKLEQQILENARRGKMRIIGPNCLGIMSPLTGLNATFAGAMARPGNVGFISQSGALCTAVLDWSFRENVGFSAFISIGSMADVGWGDLIDYLGEDPQTKSIVIYMETIGDARSFLSSAREVALTKPIIVIKAGRTQAAAKAAASHTGALTGSQEVFDAAFRRSGVLCVNHIDELFYMAEVLSKQPRPTGPRLTILTNAGGPGVLATDALVSDGGELAVLSEQTVTALNEFLPPHWSHNNPVDILGDADPQRYVKAFEVTAKDPNSDGLLVILTPQAMTDPVLTAEQLKQAAKTVTTKPILASWMGGAEVASGETILNRAGIPTFAYPDTAAQVFNHMWHYNYNLRGLYETPILTPNSEEAAFHQAEASKIIEAAHNSGQTLLSEFDSKQVLAAYNIPTVETRIATSANDAVQLAEELGYPVVLKLLSETITHKSDVGGVHLNLNEAESVRHAYHTIETSVQEKFGSQHFLGVTVQPMIILDGYEVILGSSLDSQFGPVLLFGSGGQMVEVYRDRALALPPLNTTLARRMMEQTHIFKALKGIRGRPPVDLAGLEQLMVRFSHLVTEQRWIKEIDINPLLVSSDKLIALDARIVVYGAEVTEEDLPKTAICPYPTQYMKPWRLRDGTDIMIRPIRPEDEPLMVKFHETLSERSVYYRWLHMMNLSQRIAHERLIRICFIDYDREMALVAIHKHPETGVQELIGVGRLTKLHGATEGEFAVLIGDQFQRTGLGTELLSRLVEIGRAEKLQRIIGDILPENRGMQQVSKKLGFRLRYSIEDRLMKAILNLV
ncbi:MAG: bifunctional acetate--CoA ligase family protein/GNAT family N-acetyltransferase [Chloroflexi bacterium]|nr:bifunctional acetate--CoA ligase family protein/GNAT family N-acetyltransferase [Chloroflexota bacterium]